MTSVLPVVCPWSYACYGVSHWQADTIVITSRLQVMTNEELEAGLAAGPGHDNGLSDFIPNGAGDPEQKCRIRF